MVLVLDERKRIQSGSEKRNDEYQVATEVHVDYCTRRLLAARLDVEAPGSVSVSLGMGLRSSNPNRRSPDGHW